jgi:hypothetical protein
MLVLSATGWEKFRTHAEIFAIPSNQRGAAASATKPSVRTEADYAEETDSDYLGSLF